MEKVELEAKIRKEIGKRAKTLRLKGFIPAVVYGKGIDSIPVFVNFKELTSKISGAAGRNVLISLKIGGDKERKTIPVITHDIQRDPLTDNIIHIDFLKIVMEEEIKTKVPVELIGEPVGVKIDGGILVHGLREIEVKCLPANIPDKFEVDVSSLKIGDTLHVSNIKAKKEIEILSGATEMIVNIAPPAKEEVVAAPPPEIVPAEAVPSEKGAPPPPPAPAEKEKEAKPASVKTSAAGPAKETAPPKTEAEKKK